ncbi:CotH kinase family protein [Mycoplasmatota bacterium WC30]
MKKIIALLSLIITITFISCSFEPITTLITSISTDTTTNTSVDTTNNSLVDTTTNTSVGTTVDTIVDTSIEVTTTESTTESTTEIVTTTDERHIVMISEFTAFESLLPTEISEDFTLPTLTNENITFLFFQDDVLFETNTFEYVPSSLGTNSILKVTLTYQGLSMVMEFTIFCAKDDLLYSQYLIEQEFNGIIEILDEAIPDVIESDLKLPVISDFGRRVTFSTSTSRIFNKYFIFPFPIHDTNFTLTAKIEYQGIIRFEDYTIKMKGLNNLSRISEIYIVTEDNQPITSKEVYINASFSLVSYDDDLNQVPILTNQNIKIRGRGNSTFYMPKQSFRIKFGSKTPLMFDNSESDWVLLANYSDQTLIRNYLAHSLSESMNMAFTPAAAFADVYFNGEYIGNYMLSDQIEVTNDRVDIEEHSSDLDTGYLLEMDKRLFEPVHEGVEGIDFFIVDGIPYQIKSPKTDAYYYSLGQLNYIKDYISQVHIALRDKQDYSELIDEATFIDWFIIQELFKNVDSGYSSVYMYKDKGGKLKMGPIWDFDLSTSNPGHLSDDLRGPEGWYTSLPYKNLWYNYLMEYEGFRENLKTRWNEIYNNQIQDLLNSVYPVANSIARSRYLNFQLWDVIGKWEDWYTSPEVLAAVTYEEQVKLLYDYLYTRSLWLNEEINKF